MSDLEIDDTPRPRGRASRLAQRLPRPRPGPFPIFAGLACLVLIAGLLAGTNDRTRVVSGSDSEAGFDGGDGDQSDFEAGEATSDDPSAADGGTNDAGADSGGSGVGAGGSGSRGPGGSVDSSGGGNGAGTGRGAGPAETTTSARGVTDDKIKIGVAIPDIGAFAVVDAFNLGDMRGHTEAVLDGWRKSGAVPVHGRDVEFVYRTFNIVGDEDVAACNGFVKDDKVFAVIGIRSFENGAQCLADRFDTPVITLDAEGEEQFARFDPYMFTLLASEERTARNWVHWADDLGLLKGKTIGLYEEADAVHAAKAVRETLASLGYTIAAHATTRSKQGGPEDQVAVQRFRSEGVDLAMLLTAALPAASFMEQAEAQLYRPTYIDTDYGDHTSDAASSIYSEQQYGGTLAMTSTRVGEVRAGMGLHPKAEACVANYERYSGRRIDRSSPESAELVVMLQVCDEGDVLLTALQQAGRALDRSSLIAGIESIRGLEGASQGSFTFGPGKHHGNESQRTVKWQANCSCWTAIGPFTALRHR